MEHQEANRNHKMKRIFSFLIISNLMIASLLAQDNIEQIEEESKSEIDVSNTKHNFDLGIGLGCDYSGLGIKFSYLPIPYFSTFVSGGFAFVDLAWNIGISYHLIPKTSKNVLSPHIKAMYGYNEIIWLFDAKEYNSIYYGFTPGIGVEYRFGENKKYRIDVDINFPIRSQEYKDDFKIIDDDPDVDIKNPLPFAFAIGYHWEF